MELCGGTHIKMTGEIGSLKIISEGSIAAGVRRIEAFTGESAYLYEREMEEQVMEIAELLRVKSGEVADKVVSLIQQNKDLEKKIANLRQENAHLQTEKLTTYVSPGGFIPNSSTDYINYPAGTVGIEIDGEQVTEMFESLDNMDQSTLRSMVDRLKQELPPPSGILLGTVTGDGKPVFVAGVTKELIEKGIKAGDLVQIAAVVTGGKGGGRPDMAQGGGKDPSKMKEALDKAKEHFENSINKLAKQKS